MKERGDEEGHVVSSIHGISAMRLYDYIRRKTEVKTKSFLHLGITWLTHLAGSGPAELDEWSTYRFMRLTP